LLTILRSLRNKLQMASKELMEKMALTSACGQPRSSVSLTSMEMNGSPIRNSQSCPWVKKGNSSRWNVSENKIPRNTLSCSWAGWMWQLDYLGVHLGTRRGFEGNWKSNLVPQQSYRIGSSPSRDFVQRSSLTLCTTYRQEHSNQIWVSNVTTVLEVGPKPYPRRLRNWASWTINETLSKQDISTFPTIISPWIHVASLISFNSHLHHDNRNYDDTPSWFTMPFSHFKHHPTELQSTKLIKHSVLQMKQLCNSRLFLSVLFLLSALFLWSSLLNETLSWRKLTRKHSINDTQLQKRLKKMGKALKAHHLMAM